MDDFLSGVILTIVVGILIALACLITYNNTEKSIANDCDKMGRFITNNKVYFCTTGESK